MQYRALNIKTSKELFHTTLHIWNSFDENYIKSIPHQLLAVIKSKLRPPHKVLIKVIQLFKQIIVCINKARCFICLPFENCEYFVIALNTLRFVFICPRYHIFKRSQSVVLGLVSILIKKRSTYSTGLNTPIFKKMMTKTQQLINICNWFGVNYSVLPYIQTHTLA